MGIGAGIISRRWDGLGGRLNSLLNAWSMARALGLGFHFVWPRNAFKELCSPRELFSEAFLECFEIPESTPLSCKQLPLATGMGRSDVLELCRRKRKSMIEIDSCFDVFSFSDETKEAALHRFRAGLIEIEWSSAVRHLLEKMDGLRPYPAIHVRAGDIVTGGWRQFVPVEKYTPTILVELAIEFLSEHGREVVVVVTDNSDLLKHLRSRFDQVRSPDEMIDGYSDLTQAQQAFADILVLSHARRLVGPPLSAFSQLASHLGNVPVQGFHDVLSERAVRQGFHAHIERVERNADQAGCLRPLISRDLSWFLDVFSDDSTPGEQRRLASLAAEHDPDSCGALNREALWSAILGDHPAARDCSMRALERAALADRHDDPLVESLAVSICARVLAALDPRNAHSQDRAGLLDLARQDLESCEVLSPYQIHHHDIMMNVRFQLAAATWLETVEPWLRERVVDAMCWSPDERMELKAWRPSGFHLLTGAGSFPQAVRNLEIVSIRFVQALGEALAADHGIVIPLAHVQIDALRVSPSGLRWAIGWAHGGGALLGGITMDGDQGETCVSGCITFLPRPGVAERLEDPHTGRCGVHAPVSLAARIRVDAHRSKRKRVFDRSWWDRLGKSIKSWFRAS